MTREQQEKNNETICEKLFGWRWQDYHNGGGFWHKSGCELNAKNSSCKCGGQRHTPDFYESEEASALVLEKMPFVVVRRSNLPHGSGLERWYVGIQAQPKERIPAWWAEAADRKTAIAEAALKFIEAEALKRIEVEK